MSVRKTGATVGAKPFLDHYEIDFSKTKRYDLERDNEQGLYVVSLKKKDGVDEQTE